VASVSQQALVHHYLCTKIFTIYCKGPIKYVKAMTCTEKYFSI